MALNKYMHPRNLYKTRKPDFKALAIKYPEFRERAEQKLNGNVALDFKDPASLRALTVALLKEDFDLNVTLPVDRLIPTVPQRLNYILWLEDILGQHAAATGIDIGTGASCIYPLLGCRQSGWHFLASDIDDQNIVFARRNVQQNNMADKIEVRKVSKDTMLAGLMEPAARYDFCMCNPPFFSDHLEAQGITSTRSDKRPLPHSTSTAAPGESVSWGGEVTFVTRMIDESLVLQDRVRVYSSMLGKKMSLMLLKDELRRKKISNFSSTEFCQGRTMRWGLAWTFDDEVTFPKSPFKEGKSVKPPITYAIPRDNAAVPDYTVPTVLQYIQDMFTDLQLKYNMKHRGKFYAAMMVQAQLDTWSHQRRKRREKHREQRLSGGDDGADTGGGVAGSGDVEGGGGVEVGGDVEGGGSVAGDGDTHTQGSGGDDVSSSGLDGTSGVVLMDEDMHTQCSGGCMDCTGGKCSHTRVDPSTGKTSEMISEENYLNISDIGDEHIDGTSMGGMEACKPVTNGTCGDVEQSCGDGQLDSSRCRLGNEKLSAGTGEIPPLTDTSTDQVEPSCGKTDSVHKRSLSPQCTEEPMAKRQKLEESSTVTDKNNACIHDNTKTTVSNTLSNSGNTNDDTRTTVASTATIDPPISGNTNGDSKTSVPSMDTIASVDPPISDGAAPFTAATISTFSVATTPVEPGSHQRKDIVRQFWAEKAMNAAGAGTGEEFDEAADCLVQFKLVLRKDEGKMGLTMTWHCGRKEAMHQIMQLLRNRLAQAKS